MFFGKTLFWRFYCEFIIALQVNIGLNLVCL